MKCTNLHTFLKLLTILEEEVRLFSELLGKQGLHETPYGEPFLKELGKIETSIMLIKGMREICVVSKEPQTKGPGGNS